MTEEGQIETEKRVKLDPSIDPAVKKARVKCNYLQFSTRDRSVKVKPAVQPAVQPQVQSISRPIEEYFERFPQIQTLQ